MSLIPAYPSQVSAVTPHGCLAVLHSGPWRPTWETFSFGFLINMGIKHSWKKCSREKKLLVLEQTAKSDYLVLYDWVLAMSVCYVSHWILDRSKKKTNQKMLQGGVFLQIVAKLSLVMILHPIIFWRAWLFSEHSTIAWFCFPKSEISPGSWHCVKNHVFSSLIHL